jgi:hypothetical protein
MTEKSRAVGIEEQLLQCLQCNIQFNEEDRLPTVLPCLHTLHLFIELFFYVLLWMLFWVFVIVDPTCCTNRFLTCITRTIDTYRNSGMSFSQTEHLTWKVQRMFYFSVVKDLVGFKRKLTLNIIREIYQMLTSFLNNPVFPGIQLRFFIYLRQ